MPRSPQLRTSIFIIAMLFAPCLQAQYTIAWDDPVEIGLPDQDNNRPRITLDASGNPMVIWGKNSGKEIFFSRMENGQFLATEVLLDPDFNIFTSDWAGPEIASYGDDVFVVFKRSPENNYGVYLVKSEDGGVNWSDTIRVDNMLIGEPQNRLPNIAVDASGNPVVTMMTFLGNYINPEYEVTVSDDGGLTFSDLLNTSTDFFPGEACDCCCSEVIVDGNRVVQLYRNNKDNIREIKAVLSTDGGQTYTESFEIDETQTYSNVCFSSGPHGFLEGDILYTAFRANIPVGPRVFVSVTDISTGQLDYTSAIQPSLPGNQSQNNARITGDAQNLLAVWEEVSGANTNVMWSYSSTGAAALSDQIDTLNVNVSGRQVNPDIAYANGVFHAVWQDKNLDVVVYRKGNVVPATNVETRARNLFNIYPNPTRSFVTIEGASDLSYIDLYDARMSLVRRVKANAVGSKTVVDLSDLSPGVYTLQLLIEGGELFLHKVIRE